MSYTALVAYAFLNEPQPSGQLGSKTGVSGYQSYALWRFFETPQSPNPGNNLQFDVLNQFEALGANRTEASSVMLNSGPLDLSVTDLTHTFTSAGNTVTGATWETTDEDLEMAISAGGILTIDAEIWKEVIAGEVFGGADLGPSKVEKENGEVVSRFTPTFGGTLQVLGTSDLNVPFTLMELVHVKAGEEVVRSLNIYKGAYYKKIGVGNPDVSNDPTR